MSEANFAESRLKTMKRALRDDLLGNFEDILVLLRDERILEKSSTKSVNSWNQMLFNLLHREDLLEYVWPALCLASETILQTSYEVLLTQAKVWRSELVSVVKVC
jgi:hypothetical protein